MPLKLNPTTGLLDLVNTQISSYASSVSNSDGSLTVSPTTGDVIVSLNLSHSNSWGSTQYFGNLEASTIYASSTNTSSITVAGINDKAIVYSVSGVLTGDTSFLYANPTSKLMGIGQTDPLASVDIGINVRTLGDISSVTAGTVFSDTGYSFGSGDKNYYLYAQEYVGGDTFYSANAYYLYYTEPSYSVGDPSNGSASLVFDSGGGYNYQGVSYDIYALYGATPYQSWGSTYAYVDDYSGNPFNIDLSWSAPSNGDPDYYLIIKSGSEYQIVSGGTTSITDNNTGWSYSPPTYSYALYKVVLTISPTLTDGSTLNYSYTLNNIYSTSISTTSNPVYDDNTWSSGGSPSPLSYTYPTLISHGATYLVKDNTTSTLSFFGASGAYQQTGNDLGYMLSTYGLVGSWLYNTSYLSGTVSVAQGGTGQTNFTSGRIIYGNGSSALSTSANLTFVSPLLTIGQTASTANTVFDALYLNNTTTASSGNQMYSGRIRMAGKGWKTDAVAGSQTVEYAQYVVPVQGTANPTARYNWDFAVNGGSFTNLMSLTSAGNLGIANTTPFAPITITGTTTALSKLGFAYSSSFGQTYFQAAFSSGSQNGNTFEGYINQIGGTGSRWLLVNGDQTVQFFNTITTSAAVRTGAGTVSSGALTPSADANTGIYYPAADQMSLITGGAVNLAMTTTTMIYGGTGVTSHTFNVSNFALLLLSASQLKGGTDGTAASPFYSWTQDTNIGLFRGGADILGFSTGGTEAFRIDASQNTGFGTGATVSAKIHVIKTTEQLRLGYDSSNYFSTTVGTTGGVTFNAVGAGAGFTFSDSITLADSKDISFNATTGTKIGTATSQKIGFWNVTPIVQPTTAVTAATFVANTSAIADDTATFDGYTIGQVVKALRNSGLLA